MDEREQEVQEGVAVKEAWESSKLEFLCRIKQIDTLTPWSEVEPEWWLEMMSVRRYVQDAITFPGMRNLYHAITGKDCDEKVALGMATSAVSDLLNQRRGLVENLARLCNDFKEFIDYHIPGAHPDYQLANESINVARAAIAKATGDSSPTSAKE